MNGLESEFERYLNDIRGLRTGYLSIGANNVFASFTLPTLIWQFNSLYPGVQVKMTEGNISYLEDALMQGKIDLILDNCHLDTEIFEQCRIGTEQLLLAAHRSIHDADALADHRLSHSDVLASKHLDDSTSSLPIKIFKNIPFVALRAGNDTRFRMNSIFSSATLSPNIQLEVDQLATAYNIACTGLSATLVSDTLLQKTPEHPDMCYYKLRSSMTTRPIYMYYKRSRYIPLAMQTFMDTIISNFSRHTVNE